MCSSRGPCPPAGGTTHNVSCQFRNRWQSWLKWGSISRLAISEHCEHLSVCKTNGGHWLFSFLFLYWTTCFSTVLFSEAPKFSQHLWMTKKTHHEGIDSLQQTGASIIFQKHFHVSMRPVEPHLSAFITSCSKQGRIAKVLPNACPFPSGLIK